MALLLPVGTLQLIPDLCMEQRSGSRVPICLSSVCWVVIFLINAFSHSRG
jgi:hypothetical protein